jgi:hypothetical protein
LFDVVEGLYSLSRLTQLANDIERTRHRRDGQTP